LRYDSLAPLVPHVKNEPGGPQSTPVPGEICECEPADYARRTEHEKKDERAEGRLRDRAAAGTDHLMCQCIVAAIPPPVMGGGPGRDRERTRLPRATLSAIGFGHMIK
jgi:hypothetical protein